MQILLVEDNPADARLLLEFLRESPAPVAVNVVEDGEQALAYLRRQEAYTAAVQPDLVLLDLNLPRKDGRAVLAEVKKDPALQDLSVMVLTSSHAETDRRQALALGAERFIRKPFSLNEYYHLVQDLAAWWRKKAIDTDLLTTH